MICPFCQAELDPATMNCRRCAAAYPTGGAVLGLRFRSVAIAFVLLLVTSLILVNCVLHHLPNGQLTPDMKSAEARRMLLMMQQNQQATQNQPVRLPLR